MNARPVEFLGSRGASGAVIMVRYDDGSEGPLAHLVHHSPTGMEWGYLGSGPADLARSIVGFVLDERDPDPRIYQDFKVRFISGLPYDGWRLSYATARDWCRARFQELAAGSPGGAQS